MSRLAKPRWLMAVALLGALAIAITAFGTAVRASAAERVVGWRVQFGHGEAASFAELAGAGAPRAIGLQFSADALTRPPAGASDHHHCVDRDGDGSISHATECGETHEFVVPLPDAVSRRDDIPFKWVLLNWNQHGHVPPGIYDVSHVDVHFYLTPIADIFAIKAGTCGPEFVDCDDFARGKRPVPARLMHPDF